MKTRMNQLAVAALFTFLFIGTTVSAKGTEFDVSSLENIKETTLELEDWMINENYWKSEINSIYKIEMEQILELENCMLDENNWKANQLNFEKENETVLDLESWMMNEYIWKR